MKENESRKKRNHRGPSPGIGRAIMAGVILTGILAAGAAVAVFMAATHTLPAPIQAQLDIRPDRHAKQGSLNAGDSMEVAEGSFWVVMNQLPTVEEGAGECAIQYENPPGNHYSARLSLYLEETGELLGSTTRVDPGYYVETLALKRNLPPGEYPLNARIELFQHKTPAGEMWVNVTLRVTERAGG